MNTPKKRTIKQQKQLGILAILGVIIISALIVWWIGTPMLRLASDPEAFRQWIAYRKLGGQLAYMGMVLLQVIVAIIPGEPLEIAGGYALGAVKGSLLCLAAGTLGSLLVFLLVRKCGVRLVEVFFSKEKLQSIRFLKHSPKRTVLFLLVFMIPGTPKDLLCYFAGLTDMKLPVFLLICSLGRLPSVVSSTIGGDALGTKSYWFAIAVFAVTLLISLGGLLLYQKICKVHNVHHKTS